MEDSNNPMNQPDPLLKSGAFIDPNPSSFNGPSSHPNPDGQMGAASFDPNPEVQMSGGVPNSGGTGEGAAQPGQTDNDAYVIPTPDWLPPDWTCIERVRASGATAGTRDKYYIEPGTRRRFRSKKEVEHYLKTGTPKKKKTADSDADSAAGSEPSSSSKRKKAGAKVKDAWKNFKFDDVPKKVTWELTDVYEGTWTPLVNGVDGISESEMQEWSAAFTYLSLKDAEM